MTTLSTLQKPLLQLGSQEAEVKELQTLLQKYGYSLVEDGIFTPKTKDAVLHFQATKFLKADGIVGDKTWRALYTGAPVDMPVLRLGSCEKEVKLVQSILTKLQLEVPSDEPSSYYPTQLVPYYMGEIDSVYGEKTESAVKKFQKNSGLIVDGIVGEKTWYSLSQHSYLIIFL